MEGRKRQGWASVHIEMQEAIRGYLMCVEAREDVFVRSFIIYDFFSTILTDISHTKGFVINCGYALAFLSTRIRSISTFAFFTHIPPYFRLYIWTNVKCILPKILKNCKVRSLAWSACTLSQRFSFFWRQNWKRLAHIENRLHGLILAWGHQ